MALLDRKWVWGWVITGWAGKSIKVLFLEHLSFLTVAKFIRRTCVELVSSYLINL